MAETESLIIPEKLQTNELLLEQIDALIKQKKLELDNLNHQILLAKTNLVGVQQQQITEENNFKQKQEQEKQKFEAEKNIKLNDMARREEIVQTTERECERRLAEVNAIEAAAVKLEEERKKLTVSYREMENLKSQILISMTEAKDKLTDALNKISIVEKKEKEADEIINSNKKEAL